MEKGKKILILGNGFDLAHGLPTGYKQFLEFCYCLNSIYTFENKGNNDEFYNRYIKELDTHDLIKNELKEVFDSRSVTFQNYQDGTRAIEVSSSNIVVEEIRNCLKNNIWFWFFYNLFQSNLLKGINWIDFESEISNVISFVDRNIEDLMTPCTEIYEQMIFRHKDIKQINIFGNLCKNLYENKGKWRLLELREQWYCDLECLIRALELYLSYFVERIPIDRKIEYISDINPDYVITFNYTNTYERIYHKNEEVFYIHGRCMQERMAEENNMVLGIDEYWKDDECDEHTNFAIFKKFVQRIRKKTGVNHYRYMKEVEKIFSESGVVWSGNIDKYTTYSDGTSVVYVFGHSLDVTDKDVLKIFFESNETAIKIFCKDKGAEGELIAKMIKIIHEKTLIEKSNQLPPRVEFINQERLENN